MIASLAGVAALFGIVAMTLVFLSASMEDDE